MSLVSLGPGDPAHMTPAAAAAIAAASVVAGYRPYLEQVASLTAGKKLVANGMTKEVERVGAAIEAALAGETVALVSSGDVGVYGMAGLALEMLPESSDLELEILPGVTAANAAAAKLGAPLMNDYAVISLSDLLTPLPVIIRRVEAVAAADMVIVLYNPRGRKRHEPLRLALEAARKSRSPGTVVGVVRSAFRPDERVWLTTLADLDEEAVDMLTVLVIGNSSTSVKDGRMITSRGYQAKMDLSTGRGIECELASPCKC